MCPFYMHCKYYDNMKTRRKTLMGHSIAIDSLEREKPMLFDNILKAMAEYAFEYHKWRMTNGEGGEPPRSTCEDAVFNGCLLGYTNRYDGCCFCPDNDICNLD